MIANVNGDQIGFSYELSVERLTLGHYTAEFRSVVVVASRKYGGTIRKRYRDGDEREY